MKTSFGAYHFSSASASHSMSDWLSGLMQQVKKAWQGFVSFMSDSSELRVQEFSGRNGATHWRVFNPMTGESRSFNTESEVRIWIEDRYYHS